MMAWLILLALFALSRQDNGGGLSFIPPQSGGDGPTTKLPSLDDGDGGMTGGQAGGADEADDVTELVSTALAKKGAKSVVTWAAENYLKRTGWDDPGLSATERRYRFCRDEENYRKAIANILWETMRLLGLDETQWEAVDFSTTRGAWVRAWLGWAAHTVLCSNDAKQPPSSW